MTPLTWTLIALAAVLVPLLAIIGWTIFDRRRRPERYCDSCGYRSVIGWFTTADDCRYCSLRCIHQAEPENASVRWVGPDERP